MPDVIQLPPQQEPKRLTAQQRHRHLHEHFLAFLNANNPTGFTAEEVSSIGGDTIVDLLLRVAQSGPVPEKSFKDYATRIKKASNGVIRHSRALDLVARAFGYPGWQEVKHCHIDSYGWIPNRRNPDRFRLKLFGLDRN